MSLLKKGRDLWNKHTGGFLTNWYALEKSDICYRRSVDGPMIVKKYKNRDGATIEVVHHCMDRVKTEPYLVATKFDQHQKPKVPAWLNPLKPHARKLFISPLD